MLNSASRFRHRPLRSRPDAHPSVANTPASSGCSVTAVWQLPATTRSALAAQSRRDDDRAVRLPGYQPPRLSSSSTRFHRRPLTHDEGERVPRRVQELDHTIEPALATLDKLSSSSPAKQSIGGLQSTTNNKTVSILTSTRTPSTHLHLVDRPRPTPNCRRRRRRRRRRPPPTRSPPAPAPDPSRLRSADVSVIAETWSAPPRLPTAPSREIRPPTSASCARHLPTAYGLGHARPDPAPWHHYRPWRPRPRHQFPPRRCWLRPHAEVDACPTGTRVRTTDATLYVTLDPARPWPKLRLHQRDHGAPIRPRSSPRTASRPRRTRPPPTSPERVSPSRPASLHAETADFDPHLDRIRSQPASPTSSRGVRPVPRRSDLLPPRSRWLTCEGVPRRRDTPAAPRSRRHSRRARNHPHRRPQPSPSAASPAQPQPRRIIS